jgi:arylsulfatase A
MRTPATTLFVLLTAAAVPVTAASTDSAQEVPEPARPNIVLILADDLGFGDIGAFGCPDIPTPNIDRLVAEGLRMDCAFAPMPVCSPSRSGIMTGLYPQRFGMKGNDQRGTPIPPDHPTLAETLRTSGYETAMVGRWDLGSLEQGPLDRGFETVAGRDTCKKSAAASPSGVTYMQKDGSYWTDRQADQVEEFVRRERSLPFLLYFAPLAVHFPVEEAPQHYLDRVPHGIEPPAAFWQRPSLHSTMRLAAS